MDAVKGRSSSPTWSRFSSCHLWRHPAHNWAIIPPAFGFMNLRRTNMSQNLKNIEKQLAKLEKGFHPVHDPKIIIPEPLSDADRKNVKPNERIVEDYYQNADGGT